MKTEDFETAAAHVHRFLAIDETTLKLTAGDDTQGFPQFIIIDSTIFIISFTALVKLDYWSIYLQRKNTFTINTIKVLIML